MAPRNVLNLNQKTKYKQSYNLPTIEQLKEEYNDFFDTTSEYNVSYNYKDQNTKTKLVVKNNSLFNKRYNVSRVSSFIHTCMYVVLFFIACTTVHYLILLTFS